MRLHVTKLGIEIFPESEIDEAYLENTLGLKNEGDFVRLVCERYMGGSVRATTHPYPIKMQRDVTQARTLDELA